MQFCIHQEMWCHVRSISLAVTHDPRCLKIEPQFEMLGNWALERQVLREFVLRRSYGSSHSQSHQNFVFRHQKMKWWSIIRWIMKAKLENVPVFVDYLAHFWWTWHQILKHMQNRIHFAIVQFVNVRYFKRNLFHCGHIRSCSLALHMLKLTQYTPYCKL